MVGIYEIYLLKQYGEEMASIEYGRDAKSRLAYHLSNFEHCAGKI